MAASWPELVQRFAGTNEVSHNENWVLGLGTYDPLITRAFIDRADLEKNFRRLRIEKFTWFVGSAVGESGTLQLYVQLPIPVAARSEAWVCGRSLAGIAGSNPFEEYGCLSLVTVVCCQVEVSATS